VKKLNKEDMNEKFFTDFIVLEQIKDIRRKREREREKKKK
jgi:hypothetical protein